MLLQSHSKIHALFVTCIVATLSSGCNVFDFKQAYAEVETQGKTEHYFALSRTIKHGHTRPTCSWSFRQFYDLSEHKSFDAIGLYCKFYDRPNAKRLDDMLQLMLRFARPKNTSQPFKLSNAVVLWKVDNDVYRSTLSDGTQHAKCPVPGCQFEIKTLSLPDLQDNTSSLKFDLTLDHSLVRKKTNDKPLPTRFRFRGQADYSYIFRSRGCSPIDCWKTLKGTKK